ncbi:uncharacterized protein LY89DRAFT_670498 [Mollisia scopiformis]|uniref:Fungal N-terminal domain-containing protein n=1 Tax=Mollisia scopiformis TaxID=149040 RepID=A0A194X716_MOLSC|nr:uncharacterized protein LY89DRAFT_670498 [Mollisia scopiformis]KUJ15968.1 hypothetical protein LY89DRAFT_670498 [Mollisia scopiformis]
MATGFTEDDFVPLNELVQQLSNSCKAAASVFEDLSEDLNGIHRFLEHLIKQANNPDSLLMQRCQDRRKDWLHILESLTYALCELQEHISTYYEVGADIWLQADDAQRHFNNLRSEVMVGYDAVDTFVDSLGLSPAGRKDYSLGQIEKLLVQAVRQERAKAANYGVTRAGNGIGSFSQIQRYLRDEGIDPAEVERHDARTKQLMIWVLENEPALTDIMARESLADGDETNAASKKVEGESAGTARAASPPPQYEEKSEGIDSKGKEIDVRSEGKDVEESRDVESYKEAEDLEMTAILVDRSRPSTTSRPISVATSSPSLIDSDLESAESDWELV